MTTDLLTSTLRHLEWLVACATENPPREIHNSGIIDRLVHELGASFSVTVENFGEGSINLLATRGAPTVLWNFHLDTVPAAEGWDGSPFSLRRVDERAVGLGACDIKGAVAAMLSALETTGRDAALLFTTDEESGVGCCVEEFLAEKPGFEAVVVAEPTEAKAVLAHRGIGTALGRFSGSAGHASQAGAMDDSATHEAVTWAAAALAHARASETVSSAGLSGLRFNLGRIDGGNKPNVVAANALVRFGVRPPPGVDPEAILTTFQSLAAQKDRVLWEPGFLGRSLPTDPNGEQASAARALATGLGIPIAGPVDFWTEAALFSAHGYPAIVFGPGNIAQAHSRNEWVLTSQLAEAAAVYKRALDA